MLDISQATQTRKRSIILFILLSLWPKHLIAWVLYLSRISGLEECVARDLRCSLEGSRGDRRESKIKHHQGLVSRGHLPPARSLLKFPELAKTAPPTRYLGSNAYAYEDISYSDHIRVSGEERQYSPVGKIL